MEKIIAKLEALSLSSLKDMASKLMVDTRPEAGVVMSAVLDVMMMKMAEDEFVAFCAELEG
jgi:hypothetical protein